MAPLLAASSQSHAACSTVSGDGVRSFPDRASVSASARHAFASDSSRRSCGPCGPRGRDTRTPHSRRCSGSARRSRPGSPLSAAFGSRSSVASWMRTWKGSDRAWSSAGSRSSRPSRSSSRRAQNASARRFAKRSGRAARSAALNAARQPLLAQAVEHAGTDPDHVNRRSGSLVLAQQPRHGPVVRIVS